MIAILKKFFDFCEDKNRRMFYQAFAVGVLIAICEAAKFPAIYLIMKANKKISKIKKT